MKTQIEIHRKVETHRKTKKRRHRPPLVGACKPRRDRATLCASMPEAEGKHTTQGTRNRQH